MRSMLLALREDAQGDAVQALGNLPGFRVLTPETAQRWALQGPGEYPEREVLLSRLWTGSVPGRAGTWQLWQVSLVSPDRRRARALLRLLRRAAEAMPRLAGPWSLPALRRLSAPLADQVAPEGLLGVIAGDDPAGEAAVDYDPTTAECDADTDPEDAP